MKSKRAEELIDLATTTIFLSGRQIKYGVRYEAAVLAVETAETEIKEKRLKLL